MKLRAKVFAGILLTAGIGFGTIAIAQNASDGDGNKKKKSEKVEITIENGNTQVKITSVENGKESITMLSGEEAEKYMQEHNNGMTSSASAMKLSINDSSFLDLSEMMKDMEGLIDKYMGDLDIAMDSLDDDMKNLKIQIESDGKEIDLEEFLNELDIDIQIDSDFGNDSTKSKTVIKKKIIIQEDTEEEDLDEKKNNK